MHREGLGVCWAARPWSRACSLWLASPQWRQWALGAQDHACCGSRPPSGLRAEHLVGWGWGPGSWPSTCCRLGAGLRPASPVASDRHFALLWSLPEVALPWLLRSGGASYHFPSPPSTSLLSGPPSHFFAFRQSRNPEQMLSFTHLFIVLCFGFVFCVTSPWPYLIYFRTGSLSILIPFTHFNDTPPPNIWQLPGSLVSMSSVSVFCFCFCFYIPQTSEIMHCLSFSV